MKLLLIDTCGATGGIALAETGSSDLVAKIVASETLPGRTASERLVPAIKALIERDGITLQDLGVVAVVHGPGSFTGVRVAVSAAKGLCESLNVPLVAISRLAVLAELASSSQVAGRAQQSSPPTLAESRPDDSPAPRRIYPLLDAGRGEFYLGEYADGFCLREALLTRDEVLSVVSADRGLSGLGAGQSMVVVCEPAIAESLAVLNPQFLPDPVAADALPLALQRISHDKFDDVASIDANYVRRTDAEIFAKPKAPALAQEKSVR
jgi:tRNA threonylcarbamoyladenosine biosynthesis protein TsaB